MIVETDRLLVRELRLSDVDALIAIWTDPDATRYLGGPRDRDQLRASLQEDASNPQPSAFDLWAVVEKASGRVVGHCGLLEKDIAGRAELDIVYVFEPSVWGKGYATEAARAILEHAVRDMAVDRIVALIDPGNTASQRVASKLGMRMEKEVPRPGGKMKRLYAVQIGKAASA